MATKKVSNKGSKQAPQSQKASKAQKAKKTKAITSSQAKAEKKITAKAKPPTKQTTAKKTNAATAKTTKPSAKKTLAAKAAPAKKPAKKTAPAKPPAAAPPGQRSPKTQDPRQQSLFDERGTAPAPGVGLRVPDFALKDADGNTITATDLLGTPYVLYFYPKDDTSGCTMEACGFRDEIGGFAQAGLRVIGVSPDSEASHARFRDKYQLNFTLLSDPDKLLSSALGVWQAKKNYGREYMGIVRSTFLVGADGTIQRAWRNVKVAGHVPSVLAAARARA